MTKQPTDTVLNGRAAAAKHRFETPVLTSALLVIPVVFIEQRATTGWLLTTATVANWLIWAVFAAEFAVVISLTQKRVGYARKAWLDLLIIFVSFPLLPEVFALSRLTRLARLIRVLRAARMFPILARGVSATFSRLLKRRGFGYVLVIFVGFALAGSWLFALFEGYSLADGLWWTVVTLTTVGYGDLAPATLGGRATAAVLMLTSIGAVSFITANIAAFFIEDDEEGDGDDPASGDSEVRSLHQRLDRIEELLASKNTETPRQPE